MPQLTVKELKRLLDGVPGELEVDFRDARQMEINLWHPYTLNRTKHELWGWLNLKTRTIEK